MSKKKGGRRFGKAALTVRALGPARVGERWGRKGVRGRRMGLGGEEGYFRGAGEQRRLAGVLGIGLGHWGCLSFRLAPSPLAHIDGASLAYIDLGPQLTTKRGGQGCERVNCGRF